MITLRVLTILKIRILSFPAHGLLFPRNNFDTIFFFIRNILSLTYLFIAAVPLLFCSCGSGSKLSAERWNELETILLKKDYEQLKKFEPNPQKLVSALEPKAAYFLGLHYLEAGDESAAMQVFEYGKNNADDYIANLCTEKLLVLGLPSQQLTAAKAYAEKYPGNLKTELYLARAHISQKNYAQALSVMKPLPFKNFETPLVIESSDSPSRKAQIRRQLQVENELAYLRIVSLFHSGDVRYFDYALRWFMNWDMTSFHVTFYEDWKQWQKDGIELLIPEKAGITEAQFDAVMQFRLSVSNRKYADALTVVENLPPKYEAFSASLFSDFGKAYLYGGYSLDDGIALFNGLEQKTSSAEIRFLSSFYSARFLMKNGEKEAAINNYRKAMASATTASKYDNALWYYFDTVKTISFSAVLDALKMYASTWTDPEYFEDFFFELSAELLTARRWNDFVSVYAIILPYADSETAAQYAYISGRLLAEKMADNPFPEQPVDDVIHYAFMHAYEGNHKTLYYRVLAAEQLNITLESISDEVFSVKNENLFIENKNLENLLEGYAFYGFPEKVFEAFKEDYEVVSEKVFISLVKKLNKQAEFDNSLYSEALRVASYATHYPRLLLSRDFLELLYPRPYLSEVHAAAERFGVNEDVLFGLIRTESFFDREVTSHAGAEGLAQLMKPTAEDIARKLKIKKYDLHDAEQNILFGAYYIQNLIDRLDNSTILGLFAYNGGISRVRRWQRSAQNLPLDLFLETIPFAETRDYGRKVLSSAAVYGYLYYGKTIQQVSREIMH